MATLTPFALVGAKARRPGSSGYATLCAHLMVNMQIIRPSRERARTFPTSGRHVRQSDATLRARLAHPGGQSLRRTLPANVVGG